MFGIESEDSRMKGLLEAADRRQSAIPQVTLNVESAFLSDVRDGMIFIMVHEHQHTRFAQLKQPYARVEVKVLTVCVSSILAESHKHPAYLADACKFIVVLVATDTGTHLLLEHLSYSLVGVCTNGRGRTCTHGTCQILREAGTEGAQRWRTRHSW